MHGEGGGEAKGFIGEVGGGRLVDRQKANVGAGIWRGRTKLQGGTVPLRGGGTQGVCVCGGGGGGV